jgi:hypothetical protein
MATDRPSLGVTAQPTSTYAAPMAVAAELYDQQSVNLALQFSEAFKDLSLSAANFAATMKKEDNQQQLQAGQDLINQNQKSYQQLVDSGEIKPTENPWFAVGAQAASGKIEGMKARAHFMSIYEQAAQSDPKFLDGPDGFNALAAQYTANVHTTIGDSPYLSRAFSEAFDPFVASMGMKHEENVINNRTQKIVMGVGAEVSKAVSDLESPDPIIQNLAAGSLQESLDEMGRMGVGQKQINQAAVDSLVAVMKNGDNVEKAEKLLASLKAGTGALQDTDYAKMVLLNSRAQIEANRNRMSEAEYKAWNDYKPTLVDAVVSGKKTVDEVLTEYDKWSTGAERKVSLTVSQMASQRNEIEVDIKRGLADVERQRKESTANTLAKYIFDKSAVTGKITDFRDRLEDQLVALKVPDAERPSWRAHADTLWEARAKERADGEVAYRAQVLWKGTSLDPTTGLEFKGKRDFTAYLMDKTGKADLPDVLSWKTQIDQWKIGEGINPGDEKSAKLDRDAYSRFDSMLQQMEEMSNSAPEPNDDMATKEGKANIRAKFIFMRMHLAQAFEDTRAADTASNIFIAGLNPTLEIEVPYQMEDVAKAFSMARQNNLPIKLAVNPDSPNGREMTQMLDFVSSKIQAGQTPANVLRDAAQMKSSQTATGINWFDRMKSPLLWTDMFGTGKDAATYANKIGSDLNGLGVTNPDAYVYATGAYKEAYMQILGTTEHSSDAALRQVAKRVASEHLSVKGSLVAKRDLPPTWQESPEFMKAWLSTEFPQYPDATLVPVSRNANGSLLYAARNAQGNAIANKLYTAEDFKLTPVEFKAVKKKAEENMRLYSGYNWGASYSP